MWQKSDGYRGPWELGHSFGLLVVLHLVQAKFESDPCEDV